jgi:hypothetical protein
VPEKRLGYEAFFDPGRLCTSFITWDSHALSSSLTFRKRLSREYRSLIPNSSQ